MERWRNLSLFFYCQNNLKNIQKYLKNILTIQKYYVIIRHTQKGKERKEVNEMAYKCLKCGHIFEEGEQARWNIGECLVPKK